MARIGDYESAPDASPAAWIIAGLRGSGESVLSLVPEGFEAYARIFHPAYRGEPLAPVRWRDVATANGRVAHRVMQWPSITGSFPFTSSSAQPGLWDREPEEGSLPEELATILAAVLAPHTATPGQCWFAVWDGYAALALADDQAPVFEIPHRRMLMLTGPVAAIRTSLGAPPHWQSPNLWWPEDRAWCVETEVDLMSTYVGGTRQCIEQLVRHRELEAVAIDPADGTTWESDQLNPPPA